MGVPDSAARAPLDLADDRRSFPNCPGSADARTTSPRTHLRGRPVLIQTSGGMQVRVRLVNQSVGGAGVVYPAPAETDAVMQLTFNAPAAERLVPLSVRSRVRHNHLRSDGRLIGFQFLDLNESQTAALHRFIVAATGTRTQF